MPVKRSVKKRNRCYVCFLGCNLERIKAVSKSLRNETIELKVAINLLKSLSEFFKSQRDLFDDYEEKASRIVGETQY